MWFHPRKDTSFRGHGFAADTYRDSASAQLKARDALIEDLRAKNAKLRERARLRDYIIFHLWRRNGRELVARAYWHVYTRLCGLLAAIPWPSAHARQMTVAMVIATAVVGGVFGSAPPHSATVRTSVIRPRPAGTMPTMIPVQFTWGGEVEAATEPSPWMRTWLCHQDVTLRIVIEERYPSCGPAFDYDGPLLMPPFLLKDEREWLIWIYLTQPRHEASAIVFTLD